MSPFKHHALAAALPALLLAGCGNAEANDAVATAATDAGDRLAAASDANWISLSGTVEATSPSSFILDYGSGQVTVEMDDWDFYQEGRGLAVGDPVVVTGRADRDLFMNARIEASSVYARNLDTYFYASGADEEELADSTVYLAPVTNYADATGYVTAIEGRELTLGSAEGAVRVDTSQMPRNPLDGEGAPQISVGDRVYAWGGLDLDAREKSELMASGIVALRKDATATG